LGIKGPISKLFFSIPSGIYNARTNDDARSHVYFGVRANYLFYASELIAIGPIVSYLKHHTSEEFINHSNDFDLGVRFYQFSTNPTLTAAAWTVTGRYISTKGNTFNKLGVATLVPVNKFVISLGVHGLF